ncbi:MAG: type II toxin-antitoxin system VapC family toxin [Actinomycetota bacterium]
MIVPDVNVLVYAHRTESPDHASYKQWLEDLLNADSRFGIFTTVLSGFVRVVTHPRVFSKPTPLSKALGFVSTVKGAPNCVELSPGPDHWTIFMRLCKAASVKGNLVPDAYLAALAVETGSDWRSTDRDFSRFPGLKWRHPLDD